MLLAEEVCIFDVIHSFSLDLLSDLEERHFHPDHHHNLFKVGVLLELDLPAFFWREPIVLGRRVFDPRCGALYDILRASCRDVGNAHSGGLRAIRDWVHFDGGHAGGSCEFGSFWGWWRHERCLY